MLPDSVYNIYGHVSPAEMELLYRLASETPINGRIVEIGSFQGKSTVCLGLGAKQAGAQVWAIDPHEDCQINEQTHYGMENHAALLRNLIEHDLGATVRVVALDANEVVAGWTHPIDLLFVDGAHDYPSVWSDLHWAYTVNVKKLLVHDTSGHFADVTKALDRFLEFYPMLGWHKVAQVDATAVLERA